jgi:hypothetical protein
MLGKRPDDRLDNIVESTLARCVNIDAPAGLEERILAELARRKATRGRGMQIAAFVAMTALFLSAFFRPVNSAEIAAIHPDLAVHPTIEVIEIKESGLQSPNPPISVQALFAAEPVQAVFNETESAEWESLDDEDSFISDFEVESLSISTLALADLSSTP